MVICVLNLTFYVECSTVSPSCLRTNREQLQVLLAMPSHVDNVLNNPYELTMLKVEPVVRMALDDIYQK